MSAAAATLGIFRSQTEDAVETSRYPAVWRAARNKALTPAKVASPLARRPYDLRRAAVSRWLNAGVPPTQVAEWAGHSVRILLTVYAKCIVGEEKRALGLIDASFAAEREADSRPDDPAPAPEGDPEHHDRVHAESTDTRKPPDIDGPHRTPSVTDLGLTDGPSDEDFGL
ncbi:hypothetical protein BCD48_40005 [Pseudofrankia sp. BMG5.36]|nr:hypothetical protein BCD48_40005 [Pseudofrankia sp. BMG5.36]